MLKQFARSLYFLIDINYFFLTRKPLIKAVTETMSGVITTINVAMLTLAAKATGNIPNPAFDGASIFVPNEMKYRATITTETAQEIIESGNNSSFFFSSFNSL